MLTCYKHVGNNRNLVDGCSFVLIRTEELKCEYSKLRDLDPTVLP